MTPKQRSQFAADLIAELRRQAEMKNMTRPCVLLKELMTLCDEFEVLTRSRDFYRRRCDALQELQKKMRDPERKAVCDILANGSTCEPPDECRSLRQAGDES